MAELPRTSRWRVHAGLVLRGLLLLATLGVLTVQGSEAVFTQRLTTEVVPLAWLVGATLGVYVTASVLGLTERLGVLVAIDLLAVVMLVAASGGIDSVVVPLYFAVVLYAGFFVRPQAAVIVAQLACVAQIALFGVYEDARAREVIPFGGAVAEVYLQPRTSPGQFWLEVGVLFSQLLGLQVVGALGGMMAYRRLQDQRLHTVILDSMPEGVVTVDPRGRVLYANDRARNLLGIPYDVELDKPLDELLPAVNLPAVEPLFSAREGCVEVELVDNYGTPAVVELATRVLRVPGRRGRGMIGILADQTVRQRLERAVARAERSQATGRLAAAIAHELRNPLASIRGCAQEVSGEPALDATAREMMDIVVRESDRLDHIVGEFLGYARMPEPALGKVSIAQLLRETRVMLETRGVAAEVTVELAGDPEQLVVDGDRAQLQQLLLNLGLNALQAAGEAPARVELRARGQDLLRAVRHDLAGGERAELVSGVRIEVRDHGVGIPEEAMARLFDPFFTTRAGGTGMGLAIVSRIVEAHRGSIAIDSRSGVTRVAIWLPGDPRALAGFRLDMPDDTWAPRSGRGD